MKKVYDFLLTLLWSFVGVFIGTSVYKVFDYRSHPELYAMQSAPWYLEIQINAVLTLLFVGAILVIRFFMRKKLGPQ